MNVDSKVFVGRLFKEYYLRNRIKAPVEVDKREFGFGTLEDKIKFRHRMFKNENELQNYLRRETPYYISYSAAYYEFPGNRSMRDKNWVGADLIFDLDAGMKYLDHDVLEHVKEQTINLMEFLTDDFSLDKNKISVNFSGSKGYHIHCFDESVRQLDGDGRRELVDYVTATGLDMKQFLKYKEAQKGTDVGGKKQRESKIPIGPTPNSVGWSKRIYDGVEKYIKEESKLTESEKKKLLSKIKDGHWEGIKGFRGKSFERIIKKHAVKLTGDTDKMVTLDTSRLIRLPDSLHGGTGLKAARVKDIKSFNPLNDALAFGDKEVKIGVTKDVPELKFKDKKFGPYKEGERINAPEYLAVYLMVKDSAQLVK